jgi:hypothetical protein
VKWCVAGVRGDDGARVGVDDVTRLAGAAVALDPAEKGSLTRS